MLFQGSAMRFDIDASGSIQNRPSPSIYEQKYWQQSEIYISSDSEVNRPLDANNDELNWDDIHKVDYDGLPAYQNPASEIHSDLNPTSEDKPRNNVGSVPIIHRHYRNLVPTVADPFATLPKEHAFGYNRKWSDHELNTTQRIVGGFFVQSPTFAPYQVALKDNGDQFCGGTIIHIRWIGCAAHCFERQL